MRELHVSPGACNQLARIWSYIARDSQAAADRHQQLLFERMSSLVDQPMLGPERPEFGPIVRSLAVGNYIILYELDPSYVFITHVIHGAQDIPSVIGQREKPGPSSEGSE